MEEGILGIRSSSLDISFWNAYWSSMWKSQVGRKKVLKFQGSFRANQWQRKNTVDATLKLFKWEMLRKVNDPLYDHIANVQCKVMGTVYF